MSFMRIREIWSFLCFKQKTAYEMRISDWSSDVCSSDLRLMSSDHFSVDGTLIEAWASLKSFRTKDGSDNDPEGPGRNAERGFHKEKRSNETHQRSEARRVGKEWVSTC